MKKKKKKERERRRKDLKTEQEPRQLKFNYLATALIVFSCFAVCLYFYGRGGQFFALNLFSLPVWLKFPERYSALLKYVPRLFLLALIATSASVLGAAILKLLKADSDLDASSWMVFSCAMGLGAFSYIILGVGVLGILSKSIVISIIVAPLVLIYLLRSEIIGRLREFAAIFKTVKLSFLSKVFIVVLIFSALTAFFGALSPEIFFDALFYHIGMPNYYIQEGNIASVPWNLSSAFPYLMQMLYVMALSISDGVLAKLMHYFTGLLLMASMLSFGYRFAKVSSALMAAAIFFTTPMVMLNWSVAGVEIGSALYIFITVYSMALLFEAPPENRLGALLRTALFTGLACSTKYPAFFTGVMGLAALIYFWRDAKEKFYRIGFFWREVTVYSGIIALLVSPWLIKNLFSFGNPLYPFAGKIFGGMQVDPEKWKIFLGDGLSRNISAIFKSWEAFWQLIIHPWQMSMTGMGNADFIGIVYLAMLAVPFMVKFDKSKTFKYLILFFLFSWVFWFSTTTMPRYFIPGLAIMAMILAESLRRMRAPAIHWPLSIALIIIMVFSVQWVNLILKYQDGWKVVFGFTQENVYLRSSHSTYPTPYYPAMEFVNSKLPKNSRILFVGETRSFYCKRRHIAPSVHDVHPLVLLARASSSSEEMHKNIQDKGITHIFLNFSEAARLNEAYKMFQWDSSSISIFNQWWNKHVKLVWDYDGRRSGGSLLFVYEVIDSPPKDVAPNLLAILHNQIEAKKAKDK